MLRKGLVIAFITILTSFIILSTGYGLWERTLVIKGSITVYRPEAVYEVIYKDLTVTGAVYEGTITPTGNSHDEFYFHPAEDYGGQYNR